MFRMFTIGRNALWRFLTFSQTVENFWSKFYTPIVRSYLYARVQIFIQLSLTATKLCHIKYDYPVCVSTDGEHFEHYNGGRA